MKKLLIGLLIALAVMVMLVFALNACDNVGQTANADMGIVLTNMAAPSGVVLPNSLSFDDFSGIQNTTFTSPSQFVGADEGVYARDFMLNADNSVTINGTNNNYFIVFDIVNTDNSYYVLSFSYTQSTNKVHTARLWSLSTNSQVFIRQYSATGNYFSFKPSNVNDYSVLQLPTGKYVVYEEGSSSTIFNLYRIKLEKWDSSILFSTACGFSGFVVPNYTYQPEPSIYDDWDGLVRPNCLNSPDFYNYPVFVESTAITDAYKNMWLSNMDGYVFNYNGPEVLGSLTMNVHDYGQNEDPAFLYYLDNYADSFDFSGVNAHFRLALNSQVPGTVTLTSGGGTSSERFDVGFTTVDVGLSYTQTTSFIAISIVFDRYMGVQNKTCELVYSKLEVGTMFTGYVIPDRNFSSAVKDNLLNNYNFSSVPLPSDSPRVGAWWYQYQEQQGVPGEHDESITFSSDYGGLTFDTSLVNSWGTLYFVYDVPASSDFNPVGSYTFTVQLWSHSTIGSAVEFTASDMLNDIHYRSMFPSSYGPLEYSFRFPKINGVRLTLAFPVAHGTPNTIYYAKLEEGSFTGFCGNYQEFYNNGYNAGYSDGYSLGSEAYGTSLYTLNFDNSSDYTVLDFGWSDMGFADADALFASTMTFEYIGFYRSLGYAIATQISVDVPSSSLRRLYASADINFNLSNISVAQDYVMLEIMENSSRLVIVNAQYPNDYTPEVYPDYRVVRVNVQRGLSNILDAYGDSRFEQGRLAGYDQGYSQGEVDGERRGYSQATQVAMNGTGGWFGFISAFIDVPVKALTSLLDFDFFGFNLLNLVKILLVFSLVYLVIRLITKGKVAS